MTTASTTRNPRQWRRWTVLSLAVITLVATWWNWPREDPRFCGEWRVVDELTGTSTGTFQLDRNGRGASIPAGTTDRWLFRWTFDGDRLVIGQSTTQTYRDQLELMSDWVLRVTGRSLLTVELRAEVIDVQPDRIRLRESRSSGRRFALERVRKVPAD